MKSKTIILELCGYPISEHPQTIKFLKEIGLTKDRNYEEWKLVVELKELPDIIVQINEYEKSNKVNKEWTLCSLGPLGISIYHVIYRNEINGDGYIFIPLSNVVSITTFTGFFLNCLRPTA